jgi:hypothetical protein
MSTNEQHTWVTIAFNVEVRKAPVIRDRTTGLSSPLQDQHWMLIHLARLESLELIHLARLESLELNHLAWPYVRTLWLIMPTDRDCEWLAHD